jgi:Uma2 family endonuclease
MTAEEFIAWTVDQPETERYELHDGIAVAMPNEGSLHSEIKTLIAARLVMAIETARLEAQVMVGAMAVELSAIRVYKPDFLVRLGQRLPGRTNRVRDPFIVVEVLSDSTKRRDTGVKLRGYKSLPTLHHILTVEPDERTVMHHCRADDNSFVKTPHGDTPLTLDPPGITIARFFP